jgi:hypothetical protein
VCTSTVTKKVVSVFITYVFSRAPLHRGDKHILCKDSEHPYVQIKPFKWIRGIKLVDVH